MRQEVSDLCETFLSMAVLIKDLPPEHQDKLHETFLATGERLELVIAKLFDIIERIGTIVDDNKLALTLLDFDLHVTAKERDEFKRKLDDLT